MLPNHITHYHLPGKKPFQNLSDLSEEERKPIAAELNQRKEAGKMHRGFPDWYFVQRKEAEANLRKAVIAKGVNPKRQSPHYFTLGRSVNFEWLYKDEFEVIDIPLNLIESEIYFSIGDTLWTFAESRNPDAHFEKQWYHGQLYTYAETCEIIQEIGLDLGSKTSLNKHWVFCVEAFIWSDDELEMLLAKIRKSTT